MVFTDLQRGVVDLNTHIKRPTSSSSRSALPDSASGGTSGAAAERPFNYPPRPRGAPNRRTRRYRPRRRPSLTNASP